MAKVLTVKSVEAVRPDPERRFEIPDAAMPGLYLIVQPGGAKAWALRYRHMSRPRKLTIGPYPAFGLREAREEAGKALQLLSYGTDPAAVKLEAKNKAKPSDAVDKDSFGAVLDTFMKRHAVHNKRSTDVMAMLRREVLGLWGDRQIASITKRDVIEVLDGIVDRGSPISANRTRAHLNTLFRWAKGRDIIQVNPVDGLPQPAPEQARDRILTNAEIAGLWNAAEELGYPFGALFQVLLLTGQRLREVAEMSRGELNGAIWTLPAGRSKNGLEHTIPLSKEVREILDGLPRIESSSYLFTTTGKTPVSGFTRAKERLDRSMTQKNDASCEVDQQPVSLSPFTIHDLRRTAASGMASLRFPPHVVEAVLNHKSGTRRGVAGVYNRFDYAEEKRAALDAWARYVKQTVTGRKNTVNA